MLYEDETLVWRFALPRWGWLAAYTALSAPYPPSQSQPNQTRRSMQTPGLEAVSHHVIGAVQYSTDCVLYKIVPHFDTQNFRQYLHQVMAIFSNTGKEIVIVADRSSIHRAHKLTATLDHYTNRFNYSYYQPTVGIISTPLKASGAR